MSLSSNYAAGFAVSITLTIMPESPQPLAPLSRMVVTLLYLFEAAVLAYFVYGAMQGQLEVPSKSGPLVLRGWAAWLACLFPLYFVFLIYFRFDPSVEFSVSSRKKLIFASFGVGLLALLVSAIFGSRS